MTGELKVLRRRSVCCSGIWGFWDFNLDFEMFWARGPGARSSDSAQGWHGQEFWARDGRETARGVGAVREPGTARPAPETRVRVCLGGHGLTASGWGGRSGPEVARPVRPALVMGSVWGSSLELTVSVV